MMQLSSKSRSRRTLIGAILSSSLFAPKAFGQVSKAPPRPYTIVALGDSLTAGFGVRRSEAFPARLDARLKATGYTVRIINAGLSGDTTSGALGRFDFAVPRGTQGLLLAIGANDMLQGQSPEAARANIEAMILRAKARGIKVVLLGMRAPSNWGADYRRRFDAIYPSLARQHGLSLDPFLLEGIALNPALNQSDGIHPNPIGADRIAQRLTAFVARAFGLQAKR